VVPVGHMLFLWIISAVLRRGIDCERAWFEVDGKDWNDSVANA
jgi:hypothetical protein